MKLRTFGQVRDLLASVLEPANDVSERRRGPEVLLLETKLFSDCRTRQLSPTPKIKGTHMKYGH